MTERTDLTIQLNNDCGCCFKLRDQLLIAMQREKDLRDNMERLKQSNRTIQKNYDRQKQRGETYKKQLANTLRNLRAGTPHHASEYPKGEK